MRIGLWFTAIAIATVTCASAVRAEGYLAYSFEDAAIDGFFGLGAAASQDTIGATAGTHSLKYLAGPGGFVGVRTETVIPARLNNPPGVTSILFDMNVPAIPAAVTFADIGVTIFGHDIDNGIFGVQSQFTDTVSIVGLGVGQHNDVKIDLDSEFFSGQSFDEIFGDDVTDLDVASAFQFYISKSGGAGTNLTVYIDNVRLVAPEPTAAAMTMLGLTAMGLVVRRRVA